MHAYMLVHLYILYMLIYRRMVSFNEFSYSTNK